MKLFVLVWFFSWIFFYSGEDEGWNYFHSRFLQWYFAPKKIGGAVRWFFLLHAKLVNEICLYISISCIIAYSPNSKGLQCYGLSIICLFVCRSTQQSMGPSTQWSAPSIHYQAMDVHHNLMINQMCLPCLPASVHICHKPKCKGTCCTLAFVVLCSENE